MSEVKQDSVSPQIEIGKSVPPTNGEEPFDPFSPENLRIDPVYLLQGAVKKHLTHVRVGRPSKQDFVRVHPDENYRTDAALIELEEERVSYWLLPALMAELDPNSYALHTLYLAINRQKNLFLWKVRIPGPEDKVNTWHTSAREAAEFSMKTWVKIVPNMGNRCYEYFEPVANLSEPEWPKLTFREILKLAFKGLVIEGPDHEVLKRLRGEI